MWGHPGFFSEGSKLDIPLEWLKEMIAARIAVCSVQYVKTAIELGGSYLSYGTNDKYGRYPSFIHDYKLATVDLKAKASTLSGGNNTYNVNGNKIIACGFSAGGYVALAAAMTKNLDEDSAGTKMSLAGATAAGLPWGGGYTGADPDYLGAMVFAAPIDMDISRNWDPTHPNSGSLIRLVGYRGFQALITNGSDSSLYPRQSIASHIERNSLSNLCPVAYIEGSSDFLVHWEHQELLANALTSKGVDYTRILTPNNHNHGNDIFDIEEQLVWLNSILYPSSGPESKTLFFSSGTTETGVSTEFYDGTENISKDLSKI
jgi:acetyl esterase/lipase